MNDKCKYFSWGIPANGPADAEPGMAKPGTCIQSTSPIKYSRDFDYYEKQALGAEDGEGGSASSAAQACIGLEGALKLAGPDWAKEEVETRKVRIQLEKGTLNNAKRLKRTIKMFSALKVKLLGKKMPREADDCSRINKYLLDLIAEMKAAMKVRNNPKQNAARAKKIKMQLTKESRLRKKYENIAGQHKKNAAEIRSKAMLHLVSETCKKPQVAAAPAPDYAGMIAGKTKKKGKKKKGAKKGGKKRV